MKRVKIAGVPIDPLTMEQALSQLDELLVQPGHRPAYVATVNAQFLHIARRDSAFRDLIAAADLSVADGVPLVWASRLLRRPLPGRVNGTDLMMSISARAAKAGHSIYLLGGLPGAGAAAARALVRESPSLKVAGVDCPPIGFHLDPALDEEVCGRIREVKPDIVFVGLGAPKQEFWIQRHLGLPVKLFIGVGGSFELIGGMTRRAPVLFQRSGLEWLWRLCLEPRRLWKRYLLGNTLFLGAVLHQLFRDRDFEKYAD